MSVSLNDWDFDGNTLKRYYYYYDISKPSYIDSARGWCVEVIIYQEGLVDMVWPPREFFGDTAEIAFHDAESWVNGELTRSTGAYNIQLIRINKKLMVSTAVGRQ